MEGSLRRPKTSGFIPKALTIAGSDSGGGAGIQADLKTFTSLSVYGSSVITSVTSQNTVGVNGFHSIPHEFVSKQLKTVLDDIGTDSIKVGLLGNSEIIHAVSITLQEFFPNQKPIPNLVLDPVMVASSGDELLTEQSSAVVSMIKEMLPFTFILTPNIPEAERIVKQSYEMGLIKSDHRGKSFGKISTIEDMKSYAKVISELGPTIVLIKGGHLPPTKVTENDESKNLILLNKDEDQHLEIVDVIYDSRLDEFTQLKKPWVKTENIHGTGCTLSAGIGAYLAQGCDGIEATKKALDFIDMTIQGSENFNVGKGRNKPLNHFHGIMQRTIPLPSKTHPYPFVNHLISSISVEWEKYINHINHPFVLGIGNGTLPRPNFIHYLIQDYLYLQNYARAHGIGVFKSKNFTGSSGFAQIVLVIANETKNHINFCSKWGISLEEMEKTPESLANVAYTRYVMDIGMSGDMLDLNLAIAPCLLGYGEIGLRLMQDPKTVKDLTKNPYFEWIQSYAGEPYQSAVRRGIAELERLIKLSQPSPARLKEIENIFETGTKLETKFWNMGLNLS